MRNTKNHITAAVSYVALQVRIYRFDNIVLVSNCARQLISMLNIVTRVHVPVYRQYIDSRLTILPREGKTSDISTVRRSV